MFGFNSLDFQSKYNAKCFFDYDEIHNISPQATSSSVSVELDLGDYFSETGLKSVVFYATYLPLEQVSSITLDFSVDYREGEISSVDKFLITYFDGTEEKTTVIEGINVSGVLRDHIQISFNGHCGICKFVVNHVQ